VLNTKKIPLILFILGLILIGFYGLVLSVLAIFIQIINIDNNWKNNPSQKQSTKFIIGVSLFILSLILFGIGLYQLNSYFGSIGIIMWLIIGGVPFLASSFILLTIPTVPKTSK